MIEILGVKVAIETLVFFGVFVASEVVGASKLKENGVVQLLLSVVAGIKPVRKEDEKVRLLKEKVLGIYEELRNLDE